MCSGTALSEFLDLGYTPPADGFLSREKKLETEIYFPLSVLLCRSCGLAQLSHVVSPEILYCNDYPYDCSVTSSGRAHWDAFAENAVRQLNLSPKTLVVDIGSNVGVLLRSFKTRGMRVLGIDPAPKIGNIARNQEIPTETAFFSVETARDIVASHGKAEVITATNVFAHIHDLKNFMGGVDLLLNQGGVFIIEFPYFLDLVRTLAYDTIYHEHLSYISVKPLHKFLTSIGFTIHQIEEQSIHGGSLRITICRTSERAESDLINEYISKEEIFGLFDLSTLSAFAQRVSKNRNELSWLLQSLNHSGKRIAAASAPAKGMTLLNYCHIGPEIIEFISEKTPLKIGRLTPGMHILVVSDEELIRSQPDYCLILAWNFKEEIMKNLSEFTKHGGRFIIPIPTPTII